MWYHEKITFRSRVSKNIIVRQSEGEFRVTHCQSPKRLVLSIRIRGTGERSKRVDDLEIVHYLLS